MTRATDADLGQGSVYFLDPALLAVRCAHCREHFEYIVPPVKCPSCHQVINADHLQREPRPVIIVTETSFIPRTTVVTVVPLTTTPQPVETRMRFEGGLVPGITKDSFALVHQLRAVNKASFFKEQKRGTLPSGALALLKAHLRNYFGL